MGSITRLRGMQPPHPLTHRHPNFLPPQQLMLRAHKLSFNRKQWYHPLPLPLPYHQLLKRSLTIIITLPHITIFQPTWLESSNFNLMLEGLYAVARRVLLSAGTLRMETSKLSMPVGFSRPLSNAKPLVSRDGTLPSKSHGVLDALISSGSLFRFSISLSAGVPEAWSGQVDRRN